MTLFITPFSKLRVSRFQIPEFQRIPNTSIQSRPLLIYHSAFKGSASEIEKHLNSVGVVVPHWRYTMYSTTHFHSTTHEVLSVSSGSAKLCFGHEDNPEKVETELQVGDIIVVPAGVGHRLITDNGDFSMVGSYPKGDNWDMCYGKAQEEDKVKKIKNIPWFSKDPVYGDEGPTLSL